MYFWLQNKEDADIFLSSGPEKLSLDGQLLEVLPAMFRDRIKGKNSKTKKQPKDSRSLYLIKEGGLHYFITYCNQISPSPQIYGSSLLYSSSHAFFCFTNFLKGLSCHVILEFFDLCDVVEMVVLCSG